jgi:hypothetical protein
MDDRIPAQRCWTNLESGRWHRPLARSVDCLRLNESCEHEVAGSQCPVYKRTSGSVDLHACLEQSICCSNVLRDLGISYYVHKHSPLDRAGESKDQELLPITVCPNSTAHDSLATHSERPTFGTSTGLRSFPKNRWTQQSASSGSHVPHWIPRSDKGLPSRQLGCSLVSFCGRDVYLFFPLAARLFRKQWLLVVLLALFVIAGPFARMKVFNPNPIWREYSYLGGMDSIALGCLTAMLLSEKQLSRAWIYSCGALGSGLLIFSLGFSIQGYKWGLGRNGLNFTILAVGVCLLIAAASQSSWRSPRALSPLLILGQRSYEIYLTNMFAVLALFAVFVHFGKPLRGVPVLFISTIVAAGILGWGVSVLYAEPMNRFIRRRSGSDKASLGAAVPAVD